MPISITSTYTEETFSIPVGLIGQLGLNPAMVYGYLYQQARRRKVVFRPGYQEVARILNLSPNTVAHCLALLSKEGYIHPCEDPVQESRPSFYVPYDDDLWENDPPPSEAQRVWELAKSVLDRRGGHALAQRLTASTAPLSFDGRVLRLALIDPYQANLLLHKLCPMVVESLRRRYPNLEIELVRPGPEVDDEVES